jgi:hypothetical protein
MTRPWDSIEKVERAFYEFNRGQDARKANAKLPAKGFFDKCMTELTNITPTEKAALARWLCSRMRE